MQESTALRAFAALAHETRLAVLRLLVPQGADGLSAGDLAKRTNCSASALSFHLSTMEDAGLVTSAKQSRNVIYRADYDNLSGLIHYLTEDCCCAHPDVCGSRQR